MSYLGASLMCADFLNLGQQIAELETAGIDFYHIDIMDGHFVNNFALSGDFIKAIKPHVSKPIDVHLMVHSPERYIDDLVAAGADYIQLHAEAVTHLHAALAKIRSHNVKAGVALNPATPIETLQHLIELVDVVTIMTVNPGFAGQTFINAMYTKIATAKQWLIENGSKAIIEVDGNIGHHTIPGCLQAGAEMLVLGTSALFHSRGTLADNLLETRRLTEKYSE